MSPRLANRRQFAQGGKKRERQWPLPCLSLWTWTTVLTATSLLFVFLSAGKERPVNLVFTDGGIVCLLMEEQSPPEAVSLRD